MAATGGVAPGAVGGAALGAGGGAGTSGIAGAGMEIGSVGRLGIVMLLPISTGGILPTLATGVV